MTIAFTTERQPMFDYLDELRESGVTNMFGAAPFLVRKFGLKIEEARIILSDWMGAFDE